MKIATIVVRSLLGLMFVVFGLNIFFHFMPQPPPPEGPARNFITALADSHYFYVVGALEVVGGALLLAGFLGRMLIRQSAHRRLAQRHALGIEPAMEETIIPRDLVPLAIGDEGVRQRPARNSSPRRDPAPEIEEALRQLATRRTPPPQRPAPKLVW